MNNANELRLFISSTFRDLQEEREHLVRKVFPEIRALCRERGVTFTDVDLRWGLTEEQATLGTVIRTCLEEVDRCRPFFIGMLGSRYGWVPELHEILMDPHLLASFPFIEDMAVEGASVTEMEFVHGVFNASVSDSGCVFFYHRSDDLGKADAPEQLASLIDRSRATGFPFRTFEGVEELGRMVREDLIASINREWPADDSPGEPELEERTHRAFAASRVRAYIPNPIHLKEFTRWMSEGERPLVIRGESGLGKSSLVAFLTDYYRRKNPDALVVEHYVGSSKESGTPRSVMRHLIGVIREHFGIDEEVPSGGAELERSFPGWLLRAENRARETSTPILLVVDALNQLAATEGNVGWIPREIPGGIRLVVSTTPGVIDDRLAERGWDEIVVMPIEDIRVRQSIVVRYLSEFHKGISPKNLARITEDRHASWPLFLRVVAEELRLHGDHESLDEAVGRYLDVPELADLFEQVLIRLEEDFGADVVSPFLGMIALSRAGLSEDDLREVCDVCRLDLSRLLFSLDYHLLRRDGRLDFFHDYLRSAVEERYLATVEARVERGVRLANHFESVLEQAIADGREVSRPDALELCHQLRAADMRDKLAETLSRIPVLMALLPKSETFELLEFWSWLGKDHDIEAAYRNAFEDWQGKQREPTERLDVLATIGRLMTHTGHRNRAIEVYRETVRVALETGDRRTEAIAHMQIGNLVRQSGETDLAFEELSHARALFTELGEEAEIATVTGQLGLVFRDRGEYERALECYRVQEETFRRLGEYRRLLVAIGNAGNVHSIKGEYERALASFREVEEICRDTGDYHGLTIALGNAGHVYARRGDTRKAEAHFLEQEKICLRLGDHTGAARAFNGLAGILADQGETDRAFELFERMLAIMREYDDPHGMFSAFQNLGHLHAQVGAYASARKAFDEALEIGDSLGNRSGRAMILSCIAALNLQQGAIDEAETALNEALAIQRNLGERFHELETLCQLGEIYLHRGENLAGIRFLSEAVTGMRGLNAFQSFRRILASSVERLLDMAERIARSEIDAAILDEVLPLFNLPIPERDETMDALFRLIETQFDEAVNLGGTTPLPDDNDLKNLRERIDALRENLAGPRPSD